MTDLTGPEFGPREAEIERNARQLRLEEARHPLLAGALRAAIEIAAAGHSACDNPLACDTCRGLRIGKEWIAAYHQVTEREKNGGESR